jgi:hypothetical protein
VTGEVVIWGTRWVILEVQARMGRKVAGALAYLDVLDEFGGQLRVPSTTGQRSRRDSGKYHRLMVVRKDRYANKLPLNPIIQVPLRDA